MKTMTKIMIGVFIASSIILLIFDPGFFAKPTIMPAWAAILILICILTGLGVCLFVEYIMWEVKKPNPPRHQNRKPNMDC